MSIRRQMSVLLIALSTFFVGTTWMMQALMMAPAFLRLETLHHGRCENIDEIRRLHEMIRHVRNAFASQQNHARQSESREMNEKAEQYV